MPKLSTHYFIMFKIYHINLCILMNHLFILLTDFEKRYTVVLGLCNRIKLFNRLWERNINLPHLTFNFFPLILHIHQNPLCIFGDITFVGNFRQTRSHKKSLYVLSAKKAQNPAIADGYCYAHCKICHVELLITSHLTVTG